MTALPSSLRHHYTSEAYKEAMKIIPTIQLTNSDKVVMVDDDDYERLSNLTWWMNGPGYADGWVDGKGCLMHRFIMGAKKGQEIDHINSNKLDNRKENLRFCTHLENITRIGIRKNNSTGYVGVSKKSYGRPYRAYLRSAGIQLFLGTFDTPEEAALAYNDAAKKHFGEFAYLNQVEAQ